MTKVITVTRKNGDVHEILVDADFEFNGTIGVMNVGYPYVYNKDTYTYLHNYIMGVSSNKDMQIDHINRNRMDNRKSNLRVVTSAQNSANRKVKGYTFHKQSGYWRSRFKVNRKEKVVYYKTEEEAQLNYKLDNLKHNGIYSPYYKELVK
ncbi:HNH endonuclease [Bacillus cereus]